MEKKKGPTEEWAKFVNELLEIWKDKQEKYAAEIGIFKAIHKAQERLKDLVRIPNNFVMPINSIHRRNISSHMTYTWPIFSYVPRRSTPSLLPRVDGL
jgi:hypothetical protein